MEENASVAMQAAKRSVDVIPEMHMALLSTTKAARSRFETQRRHYQRFKTEIPVAPQKGPIPSKNLF